MKNYILIISLIFMSCEESKIDFIEVNANDIKNEINKFKGKKSVLVNYWATNCSPCIDEFPMIMDLSIKYEDNLKVFFVSTDWLEDKKKALKFLASQNVEGLSFLKNQKDNDFINQTNENWSGALPFTIVFGKQSGNVVDFWEGKASKKRFIRGINIGINEGE
tara:strand:- start:869 stop:1357 length:489 start_codon:yes stop_codon:yes gene_type:complete